MPGIAKAMGTVVLRQTYSKRGHNYTVMTVPAAMCEVMGWRPGDEMGFYPVRYENGLEGMLLVRQDGVLGAAVSNLDETKMVRRTVGLRGPRPGSMADIEEKRNSEVQAMLDRHEAVENEKMAEARQALAKARTGRRPARARARR